MKRLEGKVALITGAAAGIGLASARLFAREAAHVALVDRDSTAGKLAEESLCREVGERTVLFIEADISREEDCRRMVDTTVAHFGRLDILFNNAGVVAAGRLDQMNLEDWESSMDINVRGIILAAQFALPYFRQQGGGVVLNMASVAGLMGVADRAAYSASKAAVIGLTRAMAMDYVKENIRVNCLAPGTIDTPSLQQRLAATPDPPLARRSFVERQPMGRLGTPEEVAQAALFLASDESSFVTGITLIVDGGMSL